jgi:alpha-tubulin suppressor-like RCC1 family protein
MLTNDGHIVLCGDKTDYKDAEDWYDVTAVSMNNQTLCALNSYGNVRVCGVNITELFNTVSKWSNISYATAGPGYVTAIDKNGNVFFSNGSPVQGFENLQRIECGTSQIVALTIEGKLVAIGKNEYGECNVAEWGDIMSKL